MTDSTVKSTSHDKNGNQVKEIQIRVNLRFLIGLVIWTAACALASHFFRPKKSCSLEPFLFNGSFPVFSEERVTQGRLELIANVSGNEFFVDKSMSRSWKSALSYCASEGMELGSIRTPEEGHSLRDTNVLKSGVFWAAGVEIRSSADAFKWGDSQSDFVNHEVLPSFFDVVQLGSDHEVRECLGYYSGELVMRDCEKELWVMCEKRRR